MAYTKPGLRPETTSEDIFSACKDGDEIYCREWIMNPDNDINITDQHGFTPLHYACIRGYPSIVDVFFVRGAKADIVNMGGDSLLHVASKHGKYDVVVKVLKTHPDVNLANEHGNTPLHYAAFWNYIGICEMLVKNGSLIVMSNKYGDTPLSKAKPRLKKKLEALAVEHGQELVIVPHKKVRPVRKNEYLDFKQRQAEVEKSQVTMSLKIGQDPCGETWKGSWSGHTVVVKKLKTKEDLFGSALRETFHLEYMRLRIFNHENILPLIGVIMEPQVHIIGIFMKLGSLYHVLHDIESEIQVNLEEGVRFCRDICKGMAHLHSLDPPIKGFDLNPHHVFIDEDLTAKLDLPHTKFSIMDNDKLFRPNWIAPETLQRRPVDIDRKAADMYSFAVILWEVATGKIPFADLSPMHTGTKIARDNARPVIPEFVNHHLQRIIDICWNADPNKRPRFEKIQPILDKLEVV